MMEPLAALGAAIGVAALMVCLVLLSSGGLQTREQTVTLLKSKSSTGYSYKTASIEDTPAGFIMTNDWGNLTLFSDVSGRLYRSIDYGDSWSTDADALDGGVMYGAAMSGDGKEILAGTASGGVYYSDDFGESFAVRSKTACSIVAASADLSKAACVSGAVGDKNYIYYSTNSGKKWSKSSIKRAWIGLASNADASYIVGIIGPASLEYAWLSTDGGASFSILANEETRTWGCMGHSRDLSRMIITDVDTINTHVSVDYGQTWFQIYCGECQQVDYTQIGYANCAVSGDGLSYALGFQGGQLEVVHDCDPNVDGTHECKDFWETQDAVSTSDVWDTAGTAFSYDGTYFYTVDASTLLVASGKYK